MKRQMYKIVLILPTVVSLLLFNWRTGGPLPGLNLTFGLIFIVNYFCLIATIYKSTGSHYLVKDDKGKFWTCRIRGRLKIDKRISTTNPVAVGDRVTMQVEDEATDKGIITEVADRNNYIVRTAPQNRHQKHIVAANLDQALIVTTIADPRTSQGFIDRFLVTAEAYHIPAIVVGNKADLLEGATAEAWKTRAALFSAIGYPCYTLDALHGTGLESLMEVLAGKTTLFCGHSGVGKSTLINSLLPDLRLKVQEVSDWSGKGQHTTTFAEMFDLPGGGRIIDTPGIKELGIVDISKEELAHYFPEMKSRMHDCKYNNCIHINEPHCAVKKAVEEGQVSTERYLSYQHMLELL